MKGKLIVIDGGDGAGKATQTKMLVERLNASGQAVETMDFPQYTQNTFGALIRECLDGKHGEFMAVDPKIISTLYAADRFESKAKIEQWLAEGRVVVLDRYVSSNMLHQGAKINNRDELEEFLAWLDGVEHGVFGVPRPDIILYLNVPHAARFQLKLDALREGKHGGVADVAESDSEHQEATDVAAAIIAQKNTWNTVRCYDGMQLRTREEIHEDVYAAVQKVLDA